MNFNIPFPISEIMGVCSTIMRDEVGQDHPNLDNIISYLGSHTTYASKVTEVLSLIESPEAKQAVQSVRAVMGLIESAQKKLTALKAPVAPKTDVIAA